jgi:hypothetical protein
MSGTRYKFMVSGEGKVRARGELAFVLPQALDLVTRSSYVATITEDEQVPPGMLRLRGAGENNVEAQYDPNPNRSQRTPPSWLGTITTLSASLGRNITWQPQS